MHLTRVASLFFNQPLMLAEDAADAVEAVLWGRMIAGDTSGDLGALERPLDAAVKASGFKPYSVDQGIAIVGVNGELVNRGAWVGASSGLTSYEGIAAQLKAADADGTVNGILLEINSPGGQVAGLQSLLQTMGSVSKPIWSIANSNAASAAYWVGSTAQRVAVIPDGMAGSIGAIIVMRDLTKAMEKQGVSATIVRSGSRKMRGSGMEALDETTIARAQQLVDGASDQFINAIATARGISEKSVRALEGEMLTAQEAKAARLVDTIATVHDFHLSMVAAMRKGSASGSRGKSHATATATLSTHKGTTAMADIELTQADYNAAIAQATATGNAAGVTAGIAQERGRIKAILDSPAALTRPKLAATVAFSGDISAESAVNILGAAAEEKPAPAATTNITNPPQNLLNAAMSTVANPAVGASVDDPAANQPADAKPDAKAIVQQQVSGLFAAAGVPLPKAA